MNIEHTGRVERVEGRSVFVVITSNSACGACEARKACGLSESTEKLIEVDTSSAADYAAGDEVVVSVRRRAGLKAVAIAYTLPLAVLIALLAAMKAAGAGDGAAAAVSVGGVVLYFMLLRLFSRRIANRIKFTIHKV